MGETAYLVPVGFPGGVFSESGERHGIVRVADDYFTLAFEEYALWLLCLNATSRVAVLAEATERGLANPAADLASLEAEGLVTDLHGRLDEDRAALEQLRLQLLAVGLGCEEDEPTRFRLGSFAHGPVMELDAITYALAIRGAGASSMWDLCKSATLELELDGDDLAARLLDALPALLRSCAAFLDRAI